MNPRTEGDSWKEASSCKSRETKGFDQDHKAIEWRSWTLLSVSLLLSLLPVCALAAGLLVQHHFQGEIHVDGSLQRR